MSLTLSSPAALWLLLALPLVWAAFLVARTNFNRRQRIVQAVLRSLLLASLALALARPVLLSSSSRESIVYLVDASHSVAGAAIEGAASSIEAFNAALAPAHSRIVAFARTAVPIQDAAALRQLSSLDAGPADGGDLDRSGTDLEAALLAARGELAPGHVPRIVLFSDGRATAGDADQALVRLTEEQIQISAAPMATRSIADTWIDSIDLPERVPAGAAFGATVRVGSYRDTPVQVRLRLGDDVLATRTLAVRAGITDVPLEGSIEEQGAHVIQASIEASGDPLAGNNVLSVEVWTDARARVLYLEGVPASAKYLTGALTDGGFDVTVRPPEGMPRDRAGFDPFDVVVLSDIGRSAMSDSAMLALSAWVEQDGGGLLVAGGEAIFGEGGYRDTPLERLTPVTFERKDEPEIALVLVLDRSWSMAGASMELTKAAAQAAVDVLKDEQSIGILTFNDKFDWDVPLRNVGKHREEIRKRIAAIGPGGHTLIYPAVEQAYLALRGARARARHVILLSDGRSYPGEYEALVKKMAEARITLSTVAVGPSADPELLRDLADWGNGRAYVVADAAQVPEIFVKEAKNAATPGFDEKPITPVLKAPGFLTGADLSRMPMLKGMTATVLKDTALELLTTDEEDPLLAFWPIGLGRTAVFASDVKDRWAADWVTWPGYGPFFASIVRALERQRPPAAALEVTADPVRGRVRSIAAVVEARAPDGTYRDLQNPSLEVQPAGGRPTTVATRQVAPGRYEATIVADATQPVTIRVADAEAGSTGITSRTVLPDPSAEYRFGPPDEPLLQSIAAASGGVWRPTAETLAATEPGRRTQRRPLWPALVVLALVLWFVDLLLRRVRILEP